MAVQAGGAQRRAAQHYLNVFRVYDRYGHFGTEPRRLPEAIQHVRQQGFGDVRSIEDLRCACHAVLARPELEIPHMHPFLVAQQARRDADNERYRKLYQTACNPVNEV
ncbi:hypothetical protein MKL09_29220 [Methylobacterium sp. J-048]|uniref:hypothetical protein n=1 Tax=Methylobacterium sp. J-048 TaxID=2836635 RepID=UPI001FB9AE60|nr:hypothetical protein [Methylobacterium sp. J-048]MCJ2060593.1 hypothetical protein [Methylobacterium sp. J-048]